MKILILYSGLGGNRRLWGNNHEITAVEINQDIADIYHKLYPKDEIIVGDALEYLVEHFQEFDFIWMSPPCQTHSMFNMVNGVPIPDMTSLYGSIIFLKYQCKTKWVVENVNPWYKEWTPDRVILTKLERHFFWSNFYIERKEFTKMKELINELSINQLKKLHCIDQNIGKDRTEIRQKLRNCVNSDVAKYILECAIKQKQTTLF